MKTRVWMVLSCCFGLLAPLAGADEPPQGESSTECPAMVRTEQSVPLLSQLPYLGRLFKNVGYAPTNEACNVDELECPKCADRERGVPVAGNFKMFKNVGVGRASEKCDTEAAECPATQSIRFVGPDGLERIGVDFDFEVAQACAPCQARQCAPANCPAVAVCPAPVGIAVQACEVLPAPPMVHLQPVADRDQLIEALMEARVEAAIAQTALKIREESNAEQLELIKELVESQVENAKLAAKLELAAEKEKLLAQLIETHIELATLKAQAKRTEVAQRKDAERLPAPPAEPVETLR